jgi:Protein of unknown function (DUF3489)
MAPPVNKLTYTVDAENGITAHGFNEEVQRAEGTLAFTTENEFEALAADWPTSRLLDIWNRMPGHTPVKKFTSRETAIRRIWKAVQALGAPPAAGQSSRQSKTRKAKAAARMKGQAAGTKSEIVLALLRQPGGATLNGLMAATGWQAHSVRGFISGQLAKKMRLKIKSFKRAGERVYSIRS